MTLEDLQTVLLTLGARRAHLRPHLRAVLDELTREGLDRSTFPHVTAARRRYAYIPKRYEHLDFTPPKGAQEAAAKGLELRRKQEGDKAGLTNEEAGEQGIGSGVQRAVNLKNGTEIEPDTIRQMHGFFSRFRALIAKARKLQDEDEILKSNMHISDLLWGGEPAEKWVARLVEEMDKADEAAKKKDAALARRVASAYLYRT